MATCFNHHLAYELTMPDPTSYPGFAFMITTFREDGSKCDDYSYNATWGSAYVYSLWLSRLANLPQPSGILDRTPGLMDVLNQFLRHPGYMVTTRTGHTHYPCSSDLLIEAAPYGQLTVSWTGDHVGADVRAYYPLAPPATGTNDGGFVAASSPFTGMLLTPNQLHQCQMTDPITFAIIATSNQVLVPPYDMGPLLITVTGADTFVPSWPNTIPCNFTDFQFKIDPADDWTELGDEGPFFNGVEFLWSELDWYWRVKVHHTEFGLESDWSNTFFM